MTFRHLLLPMNGHDSCALRRGRQNAHPFPFLVTARAENYWSGDLISPTSSTDSRRTRTLAPICCTAPGLTLEDDIGRSSDPVDRPVNVVMDSRAPRSAWPSCRPWGSSA